MKRFLYLMIACSIGIMGPQKIVADVNISTSAGTVTVTADNAGDLAAYLNTATQAQLDELKAATIVFVGKFNSTDLSKLNEKGCCVATTVNMGQAKFIKSASGSATTYLYHSDQDRENKNDGDKCIVGAVKKQSVLGPRSWKKINKSEIPSGQYVVTISDLNTSYDHEVYAKLPTAYHYYKMVVTKDENNNDVKTWEFVTDESTIPADATIITPDFDESNIENRKDICSNGQYAKFGYEFDYYTNPAVFVWVDADQDYSNGSKLNQGDSWYATEDEAPAPTNYGQTTYIGGTEYVYQNGSWVTETISGEEEYDYSQMDFSYWKNTLEKATTSAYVPGDFVIAKSAFSGCTKIQEVVFNSGIIGSNVLGQNSTDHPDLTKVTIGAGVTEIQYQAFHKCPITNLDWSNATNLTKIGEGAFEECPFTNVTTLTIPASVKEIQKDAFKNICKSLINVGTGGVRSIVIPEDSHLYEGGIGEDAFRLNFGVNNDYNPLKDVYVKCDQEIPCHVNAFSFENTDGQSQEAQTTARTRLHYPPNHYEFYVGSYKSQFGGNGIWTQADLINNRDHGLTDNGWRRFSSAGILMTSEVTWRTYSDVVALTVPAVDSKIDVYLVCDYQNGSAILVKMKAGDCIPAGTGILVHYVFSESQGGGVLFFAPYDVTGYGEDDLRPYQTFNTDDKRIKPVSEGGEGLKTHRYTKDGVEYDNFLEGIHETSRYIYNAENGNYLNYDDYKMAAYKGQKVTYRNFFFNKGDNIVKWATEDNKVWYYTGNGIKGFDPNKEGKMGWGFFRVISDIYTVNSKAFLRLPASKFTDPKGGSMIASDNGTNINEVTSGAKGMGLIILGEEELEEQLGIATAITSPDVKTVNDSDSFYTLQGVKVNTPTTRGVYIHNGKKIVVK